ncbi:MAG: glycosyltransferase family 4 protein [Betaproteobacteria bacterium]
MRVAVVHDWLYMSGGAERVLEQILQCVPHADVFSLFDHLKESDRGLLAGRSVATSFIQRFPFSKRNHRWLLPLMPLAIEQFDMSSYDIVISSSHAVAKGVLTGPDQLHVSYVHSPMRYAWDLQHDYLRESRLERGAKGWLIRWFLHRIRLWDLRTANGVDAFIANSHFIARRIWKVYRRDAQVIYPPVSIDAFGLRAEKENFYFTASRMVPYKKIGLIVGAFSKMPQHKLVVVGDGPEFHNIKARAGSNVELLGYQPFDVLRDHMQRAKAFVFAAEEDFGIAPVEAQACGTPVIAFGKGGVLETVRGADQSAPTGIFFAAQTTDAIIRAVEDFEASPDRFTPAACHANAQRFSPERFRSQLSAFLTAQWSAFDASRRRWSSAEAIDVQCDSSPGALHGRSETA